MISIHFDTQELTKLAALVRGAKEKIHEAANKELQEVSLDMEREIKVMMPVLTGRAKSSWSHWTEDMVLANPEAKAADAIWQVEDLEVTEGTQVHYVELLNEGSSRKAPAGFIDLVHDKGTEGLAEKLVEAVVKVL